MKIKSLIALFLTLLMCFPFLVGCGKTSEDTSDTTSDISQTENKDGGINISQGDFLYSDEDLFANKDDVFNVLLLGVDEVNDFGTTDAIMLMSVSKAQKKIKFVSLMEDTYVSIPGYSTDKLSMAYSLGGAKLAVQTVSRNFGIDIHRYALMNFFTFEDVVNVLEGVELDLTDEDISYVNALMIENDRDDLINVPAGKVTLNGMQALCYVRNCSGELNGKVYTGDDFTRGEKQRAFMNAVLEKLSGVSVDKLVNLANNVAPFVNTDMTMEEKSLFVANILTYLDYEVEGSAVPFDGTWSYENGDKTRINIDDWSKVREELHILVYGE